LPCTAGAFSGSGGAGLPAATSITCKPPPNHTMFAIDREFDKANS